MKNIFYILTILISSFICMSTASAEEYLLKIRDVMYTSLYKSASTSSSSLATLYEDEIYTIIDADTSDSDLDKSGNFYKIQLSDGTVGYVNSNNTVAFIDLTSSITETTKTCIANLEAEGFYDETYLAYLCFLQMQHPTWNFIAVDTDIEWDTAVTKESSCSSVVISYIPLTSSSQLSYYSNYISTECDSKSVYDYTYYAASYDAVSYHMDPRNFLNENYIFQFENLVYDESYSSIYESLVYSIIYKADFYTTNLSNGNDLAALISSASEYVGINPTHLASRIYQELGTSITLYDAYSGKTSGYIGYYNFINWGAYDSCVSKVTCALDYAVKKGWYGVETSLIGAAYALDNGYISAGQYTFYFQKFNVSPTSYYSNYTNQYQTNIEAPSSEAYITYSSYYAADLLDLEFTFAIPIFKNMPELVESDYTSTDSSEEGYSTSSISTIVTTSGYTYDSSYISGIAVSTSVSTVKTKLESYAGTGNVVILDSDSKEVTSGIMKTGYKVKITNSSGTTTLTVVIYGDTSGDGLISALDLLQVQKNIVGLYTLSGAYKKAADTSKDDSVSALDLLQIQKNIVGLYTISQ